MGPLGHESPAWGKGGFLEEVMLEQRLKSGGPLERPLTPQKGLLVYTVTSTSRLGDPWGQGLG